MHNEKLKRTSKFLSLVLRHQPDKIGLELDEAGWTNVDLLLSKCTAHGMPLDRHLLNQVVAENDKKRFAFSEDGQRIRASQGHSVEISLGYQPATPPNRLFHGTAFRFLESIRRDGLQKGKRHHVHLSTNPGTATAVGGRHGKPAILEVLAAEMQVAGYLFYLSENNVWLTDSVPTQYLVFPNM